MGEGIGRKGWGRGAGIGGGGDREQEVPPRLPPYPLPWGGRGGRLDVGGGEATPGER